MANPTPEIMPEAAAPYVAVMATGRSDYPNQINNVLCFPGIFRGALACRAARINEEMKLAAANAIAGIISDAELHPEYIVPSVFDKRVEGVAREVSRCTRVGVARRAATSTRTEPDNCHEQSVFAIIRRFFAAVDSNAGEVAHGKLTVTPVEGTINDTELGVGLNRGRTKCWWNRSPEPLCQKAS